MIGKIVRDLKQLRRWKESLTTATIEEVRIRRVGAWGTGGIWCVGERSVESETITLINQEVLDEE